MAKMMMIEDLIDDANNPRRLVDTDKQAFKELQNSIASSGILQPILVRLADGDEGDQGLFMVISGHRRLAAARVLKLGQVPVEVRKGMSESQITEAQLIENLQREDLDPVEEAVGYFRLVELGTNTADLGKRVGRSKAHVAARLKLLKLPPTILAMVKKSKLSVTEANELLTVEDKERREEAIGLVLSGMPPERATRSVIAEAQYTEEANKIREKCAQEGWDLIELEGYGVPEEMRKWRQLQGYEGMGLTDEQVKEHRKLGDLHVVVLRKSYGSAKATEYSKSPPATKKALGLTSTLSEVDQKKREERRRERAEKEHRREFITTTLLRGRSGVKARTMSDLALASVLEASDTNVANLAAQLLGCPVPPGKASERPYAWGRTWITDYGSTSQGSADKAFLALLAAKQDIGYGGVTRMFKEAVLDAAGFEPINWEAEKEAE